MTREHRQKKCFIAWTLSSLSRLYYDLDTVPFTPLPVAHMPKCHIKHLKNLLTGYLLPIGEFGTVKKKMLKRLDRLFSLKKIFKK
jgi:hypothetical protein